MAQVTARKRGAGWEYRFELALVGGKRKQHSKGGFRTKSEALKAGNEAFNIYMTAGTVCTNGDTSVSDFIDDWVDSYAKPNLRKSTLTAYESIIRKHIRPKIGKYMLKTITHGVLQNILNQMASDGYKKNTIYSVKAILQKLFAYASSITRCSNPATGIFVPKNSTSGDDERIHAYTMDEANSYIEGLKGSVAYYPALVALHTGMRAGEILALTWQDINFENNTIIINKTMLYTNGVTSIGPPKTDKGYRTISFGVDLKNILKKCKIEQKENELYYGEHYIRCYIDKKKDVHYYSKWQDVKNMEPYDFVCRYENGKYPIKTTFYWIINNTIGNDFKFHNLRHTHATILFQSGVSPKEIQERLGHASVATTLDKYVDSSKSDSDSVHAIEKAWANRGQKIKKEVR